MVSAKSEFVECAKSGRILGHRCTGCGSVHLATIYFCAKCGSRDFERAVIDGRGSVATYTIITVPPEGFEKHAPYAWVIVDLDGSEVRVSGFMAGISKSEDLPLGTRVRVSGFDERGIILERDG